MPKLTAPQLLWTGVVLVVVGILGGWIGQALLLGFLYRASWLYGLATTLGSALVVVGAALIGGGFVVAALQRGPARDAPPPGGYPAAQPGPFPYPPTGGHQGAGYPAGAYPPPTQPGPGSPYAPGPAAGDNPRPTSG
jgi:hypothetical protein